MKYYSNQRGTVIRTLLASLAILAVTFTVLSASDLFHGEIIKREFPEGIPATPETLRAMTVRTQGNADFPSAPGLPAKEMQAELDEIAAFANTYGYNAIFFEAVPECDAFYQSEILPSSSFWTGKQGGFTFFDPLRYLTNISKTYNIQVYAVVDAFGVAAEGRASASPVDSDLIANGLLDPDAQKVQSLLPAVVKELTGRYDVAGVVFAGVDSKALDSPSYAESLSKILSDSHDSIRQKGAQRLGIVVNSNLLSNERDFVSAPVQAGDLDFVVTSMVSDADTADGVKLLQTELSGWEQLCENASIPYYPLHIASDETIFTHSIDNSFYFERQFGAGGSVISNYGSLHTERRMAAYSLASSFRQQPSESMPDLSYSRTFQVTRPAESITLSDTAYTTWKNYFITGTSNPDLPVLYNGKEVDRPNENGLWGVLVDVEVGTNNYTFSQNGTERTVQIIRKEPAQAPDTISTITKSSVYPANPEAVLAGRGLKLSCTAPAGGKVTARVGGLTTELEPVSSAEDGVAVTYQQTLDLSSLAVAGQVKRIGPVTYSLSYNGMNSSQQSAGEVYVAGAGAEPVARINSSFVPISSNGKDDGEYTTVLKGGCVDTIVENNGGGYYLLSSGGYALKSTVEILEGKETAVSEVSSILLRQVEKGEQLVITSTKRPAFTGEMADGSVRVTLYNLSGFEQMDTSVLNSTLCSSIESSIAEDGSTVTLTFQLNPGCELTGWNVQFDGENTVIYLKQKPRLQRNTGTPLAGVTILLDPGHGGTDPGAASVPYNAGPWENILNYADSCALQSRLEALGATVHLTQRNETMTLNERMAMAEQVDADMFISSHHNSLSEQVDSNKVEGIEVYYYNGQSQVFAENIGANLASVTGRKLRFVNWSWYRVTMLTSCPAVLVESGYICSPAEFDRIASDFGMFQYANGVADAVLQYFQ